MVRVEFGKARCRFHGGLSTGPKTEAGRARIAEAQRQRWRAYREGRKGAPPGPTRDTYDALGLEKVGMATSDSERKLTCCIQQRRLDSLKALDPNRPIREADISLDCPRRLTATC
jgi:hypothetical protein